MPTQHSLYLRDNRAVENGKTQLLPDSIVYFIDHIIVIHLDRPN